MGGWELLELPPPISSMEKTHAIFFKPPLEINFLGHQMAEIYRDRVYASALEGKKDLTIIDCGANIGLTTYYFSQFAKIVYSIEPSKEHFEILQKMVEFNKLTNVNLINKAIYIKKGNFPFGGPIQNKTMKSLHMATWQDGKPEETVETLTFKDLFEENKISHVDLLKLDIEGTETEVISHTSFTEVAPKINTVIVERHGWSGRHENQLIEAFKNAGYQIKPIIGSADLLIATR